MTQSAQGRRVFTPIEVRAVVATMSIAAILALPQFLESRATARQADVGNREPAFTVDGDTSIPLADNPFDAGSTTTRIHGGGDTWEGTIAHDSLEVEDPTSPDHEQLLWTFASPRRDKTLERPHRLSRSEHHYTRAVIDGGVVVITSSDARGIVRGSVDRRQHRRAGAHDQSTNHLRPIAKVVPDTDDRIEAHGWIG